MIFRRIIIGIRVMMMLRKKKATILIDNDEIRLSHIMTDPNLYIPDDFDLELLEGIKEPEDFEGIEGLSLSSYILLTEKKDSLHFDKHEEYLNYFKIYILKNGDEIELKRLHTNLIEPEISEELISEANVEVINNDGDIHYLYEISSAVNINVEGGFLIKYHNPTYSVLFQKKLKQRVRL